MNLTLLNYYIIGVTDTRHERNKTNTPLMLREHFYNYSFLAELDISSHCVGTVVLITLFLHLIAPLCVFLLCLN